MIWLVALLCLLVLAAALARVAAGRGAARSGLPAGKLLYNDAGKPVGRLAPTVVGAEGVKQEKPLLSRTLGLVGRPDYLIETTGGIVPVEIKSAARPAGGRPYDSHVAQLAAYCLLVEDVLGEAVPYGLIRYRDGEARVEFTAEVRQRSLALIEEMRAASGADDVHRSHEEARRCAGCSMRDVCTESLA
jgi:CRISPR-associated exonuclease Cas4